MSENRVDAYVQALRGRNMEEVASHLSEDITLLSPLFPEPFHGKAETLRILTGLMSTIDDLVPNLHLEQGNDAAMFFTVICQGVECNGNEHLHLNAAGLIDRIMVAWRPLENLVKIQQRLAAKLGGTPLRLVPAE